MNLELHNRVILITGGAKGIGAAITRALVAEGARPAVLDRDPAALTAITSELGNGIAIAADLRDPDVCRDAVTETVSRLGAIDAVSSWLGITRLADVFVYTSIAVLFYLMYRIYMKIESLDQEITKLTRIIAFKDNAKNEKVKKK